MICNMLFAVSKCKGKGPNSHETITMTMHQDGDIMLHDAWTYRFHDPDDSDWTLRSYVQLAAISSVADMWNVQHALQDRVTDGMFFVTREHIFPCWDDPSNIHGGSISLKVPRSEASLFWEALLITTLSEHLIVNGDINAEPVINGISISPKRHYCIMKVWLRDSQHRSREDFHLPCHYQGEVLYRSSLDMIQSELTSGATDTA